MGSHEGVDHVAMAAALDAGGVVVGVPAEGIRKVSRNAEIRRRVHEGELCIASPFGPTLRSKPAMRWDATRSSTRCRRVTFVVSSDKESGGTWAGAKEALDKRYAPVAVWTGAGAREGNEALVRRGASAITDVADLFALESSAHQPPLQNSLF